MSRNLRLLVMPHLNGEAGRERRDPAPLGRPAAPAGVEIADVDRVRHHEIPAARAADLALAGADRNAGLAADGRHVQPVVAPVNRFLEPADVEIGDLPREGDRLAQAETLIGVDGQHEIVAGGLAGDTDALGVLLRRAPADLELAAGVAARANLLHFPAEVRERLVLLVISGDADDRQPVRVASPKP